MIKTNFAYISGLIRILETRLLNQNELERMIDAKSFQDAFRVMNELDYARFLDMAKNPQEFQKVLDADMLETKKLFLKTCPYPWFLNIFWYRYDTHNIKTLLKAKLMGKTKESVEHLLMDLGNISHTALADYIFDNQRVVLDPKEDDFIKKAITKATNKFKEHNNPQEIDFIIDRVFFQLALKIAKKSNVAFIVEYIQHLIDLSNIKLYFRLENWKTESPDKIGLLLKGGTIPFNVFFFEEADFLAAMSRTIYKEVVDKGMEDIKEKDEFIRLENESENFIAEYIRKKRFEAIGPEVVMNYFHAKKNNAMVVRMVLIGKMNGVEPETIRKHVRTLYSNLQ